MRQLKITKSITNRESASLDKYLQEIGRKELITVDEEVELAQRIRMGDQAARDKLVSANLRFVVSVAKQYQNQGLSLPDLIDEGNFGLIKAAQKFDETRGFKFISYAVWWIRQSILQALAEQSRIVRLPLNQVGSLNKISKAVSRFEQEHERRPSANTEALSLSDVVRNEFLGDVERKEPPKETNSDLVSADSIVAKELFYNEAEAVQIGRLAGLLEEENYQGIRSRLSETGMRKGFNVLFYGAPGTGKTASAFELARRSGRDIFVIDMSKLRSKWVGDSEKCIKSVFSIYRRMCRKNGRAPILLFNEADAIFMKRIENVEHSVDQMNNTMQNIILQEMENLDGILIATTNLVGNLDPAFERRFLYKVEFHKPDAASRAKIWKSMIGSLSEADATTLARRYEFSGGNIENVARKSSVEYVLTGQQPTVDTLSTFCEEETYGRMERKRIGF